MTEKVYKQKCFSWLYRGGLPKKGGLGQFADLRGEEGARQEKGGGVFEVG